MRDLLDVTVDDDWRDAAHQNAGARRNKRDTLAEVSTDTADDEETENNACKTTLRRHQ